MRINSPYIESTSEKLGPILRSYKIRPTLYTVGTLHQRLCKLKTSSSYRRQK